MVVGGGVSDGGLLDILSVVLKNGACASFHISLVLGELAASRVRCADWLAGQGFRVSACCIENVVGLFACHCLLLYAVRNLRNIIKIE